MQPRFALDPRMPFTDNRTKFSIGWGMYDIPLNLAVIGQAYDQQQVDTVYDPDGENRRCRVRRRARLFAGGRAGPIEAAVFRLLPAPGWQQRIGENTLVSVELLARDQHHGLVWETLSPGQIGSRFSAAEFAAGQISRRDGHGAAHI